MSKKKKIDPLEIELEQWYRKHIIKLLKERKNEPMVRSWVFHSIPIAFNLKGYSLEGIFCSVWKEMIKNEELVFDHYEMKRSCYYNDTDIPTYQLCEKLFDEDLDFDKTSCII